MSNGDDRLCPECGAPMVDGLDCWGQLGGIIAWEYEDPELLAEHFKTVATYNLQHPAQYTDVAMEQLRSVFIEHIDGGLPISEIRRRVGKTLDGNKRVRKDQADRWPIARIWTMTISDVYIPNQPEGAAARVRAWAKAVRAEL